MPTPLLLRSWSKAAEFNRRDGAIGAVLKDEAGEEEAAEEEVDRQGVEDAETYVRKHFQVYECFDLQYQQKKRHDKSMLRAKLQRALLVQRLEVGGRGGGLRVRHVERVPIRDKKRGLPRHYEDKRRKRRGCEWYKECVGGR